MTTLGSAFAEAATANGEPLYAWNARPGSAPDGSAQRLFFFLGNRYLGTDTALDHAPI